MVGEGKKIVVLFDVDGTLLVPRKVSAAPKRSQVRYKGLRPELTEVLTQKAEPLILDFLQELRKVTL